MRQLTVLIAVSLVLVLPTMSAAQPVLVRLHVPPPNQANIENLWWVDLTNTTQNTYTARLRGEVSERQDGLVYRANTDSFRIPPGRKRVTLRDVHIRDQWAKPGYETFIVRTGLLPEGDYTYKIWLEPNLGGDSGNSSVRHPTPPRLIGPRDGEKVPGQQPVFSWTRPGNYTGAVKYRLTIVEVMSGQTPEEALRSNRPFFQQSNIPATQFRYPLATRRLDWNKPFAWRVEAELPAGRGGRIASENRGFFVAIPKPKLAKVNPLTLTREVTRQGNGYSVLLTLKNNTNSAMTEVVVTDSNLGFQVLDRASVHVESEGGAQQYGKKYGGKQYVMPVAYKTGTDNYGSTSWMKVTRPNLAIPAGGTLTIGYTMMPLQYIHVFGPGFVAGVGCRVTYKYGDEQRAKSFNSKSVEVNDCAAAWKTADYLIVTNPIKLYQQNSGARDSVDKLLATMARLASLKKGVMLHFPATSASQLRQAIKYTASVLAPGWLSGGYLLLVGESEIVPCWDTVWCAPERPAPWSDHQYSDLNDDYYPELKVGRIIGTTASELTVPLRNSIAVQVGEGGAHYDGFQVLIVTGVEKPDNNFTPEGGPGAQYLNTRGVVAHYWGQEFIASRPDIIAKALTHTPIENGGAAQDTHHFMLTHYSQPGCSPSTVRRSSTPSTRRASPTPTSRTS
jgi:hypothetical protein